MINSVSFGNTNFNDLVSELPKYSTEVSAATDMYNGYDSYEKKGSTLKTIGKITLGAAVVAAGLALLRGKVGMFKDIDVTKEADTGFMNKVKYYTALAGQKVIDGYNWTKSKIPFLNKKVEEEASGK